MSGEREPMRSSDMIHGDRLIVAQLDEHNRYYVTGRTWLRGPDGERFELLQLSHVTNWDTTRTPKNPPSRPTPVPGDGEGTEPRT